MDIRSQLEQALGSAYTIERELGHGGMATVFLARDTKHHRQVALKVLHPDLAHALGAERFLREIEIAAGLQHPHILTVHDSGAAGNLLWYTMPFVEGESLRDRLTREKQLPLDDALRLTREAADALDYAHRHGVVHRDIKPENILLTESHALVADFGIGKALGQEESHLTATGLVMGTAAYMSPEQATGDKAVGPRSDIYSLATVLYELLAGAPPFDAPTAQAMLARRLTETSRPIRELCPEVPPAVELALARALASDPEQRFATAAEFARALAPTTTTPVWSSAAIPPSPSRRRFPALFATLMLGLAIGAGVLFAWRGKSAADEDGIIRMAVLPFENLGDSADAYFADGMTDEVRGKLSGLPQLQVTARQSAAGYRGSEKSLRQIGEELGVRYLLTATVRWEKSGGTSRVRVTPELVEVASASTRWQQPFDASMTDVFRVQGEIATLVAQALDVELTSGERETLEEKPTENLDAYDAFLRGEAEAAVASGDLPAQRRALAHYERAVALDSMFALAWARMASTNSIIYGNSAPLPAVAAAARRAVERALQLAPERAYAHVAMAYYAELVLVDNDRQSAELATALRLDPSDMDALVNSARVLRRQGLWDSALVQFQRLSRLDPRSPAIWYRYSFTALTMGKLDEAQAAADRGRALIPTSLGLIQTSAKVKLARGDLEGARRVLADAASAVDRTTLVAYMGAFDDLYWVLDQADQQFLIELPPSSFDDDRGTWAITLAQAFLLRGDSARARAFADTAASEFTNQLRDTPDDPLRIALVGLARAIQGRKAEAVHLAERAVELSPLDRDVLVSPYLQHQLVRIHLYNRNLDRAMDELEKLRQVKYQVNPAWMRIDPNFAPLWGNPRFEAILK